ncbi:MAG: deoxyribonuclease IV [Chloroflexota bacterium]|nr:MAG: deoxyribonuclease IV [Chloroflexota bacterium]
MRFGAHMSIAGGLHRAFAQGQRAGCDVIQIFSKNQQQWRARPLTAEEIAQFRAEQEASGIRAELVHDSYLINLASPDDALWEKSTAAFRDELERCSALGIPYLVTHPGAHVGSGEEAGLARVAEALNRLFAEGAGPGVTVLLETTAGQGSSLGYRFEHLARLIERSTHPARLGVCVDTCHLFAAGYDIRTPEAYEATFAELGRLVGLERVRAFHLNDSQKGLGSRVDRHTHIGEGCIGLEGFRLLVNDARFAGLPMVLETPKGDDLEGDIKNLATLRGLLASPGSA